VVDVAESFERDTGGTEADWLRTLPGACGAHPLSLADGQQQAQVRIATGTLHLQWQVLPPRRIALVSLPRMLVCYRFDGVAPLARQQFMKYFDLFMQRGGG
jgi:hypothetical protein